MEQIYEIRHNLFQLYFDLKMNIFNVLHFIMKYYFNINICYNKETHRIKDNADWESKNLKYFGMEQRNL